MVEWELQNKWSIHTPLVPLCLFWFTTLFVSCGSEKKNHQMCTNHLEGRLVFCLPPSWLKLRNWDIPHRKLQLSWAGKILILKYKVFENPRKCLIHFWFSHCQKKNIFKSIWIFSAKIRMLIFGISTSVCFMTSTVTFFAAIFQLISLADVRWKSAR